MVLMVVLLVIFSAVTVFIIIGNRHNGANWGHSGINALDGWIRLYCRKFHRQNDSMVKLPKQQNVLLVCNHISAVDPFILIAATNRPIRFMIAIEEYQRPILRGMFRAAGCIPVDRSGRVEGAFRSTLRTIKSGELVAIFPQGGIHSPSNPRPRIKPGIIKLSHLSGCCVLPVRILGVQATSKTVKALITRSHASIETNDVLSTAQVQSEQFTAQISDWFVGKTERIEIQPITSK